MLILEIAYSISVNMTSEHDMKTRTNHPVFYSQIFAPPKNGQQRPDDTGMGSTRNTDDIPPAGINTRGSGNTNMLHDPSNPSNVMNGNNGDNPDNTSVDDQIPDVITEPETDEIIEDNTESDVTEQI